MGGGGLSARELTGTEEEILLLMMPVYYIHNAEITPEDIQLAKAGWNLVITNQAPLFVAKKGTPGFEYKSCISWFYTTYYDRLLDIHPSCRPLFTSGLVSQGKFLVKFVSTILSQLGDKETFKTSMQELAIRHCQRGVKGVEYGIVGDVLFYALQTILGPEVYNAELEMVWRKIYSSMLTTIIPLVIQYERNTPIQRPQERYAVSTGGMDKKDRKSVV